MIGHCLVVARGRGVSSTVGVDDRPLPCGGEGRGRGVHGRGGSSATARWRRGRWRVVHGRGGSSATARWRRRRWRVVHGRGGSSATARWRRGGVARHPRWAPGGVRVLSGRGG